jgi:hypothetical protein
MKKRIFRAFRIPWYFAAFAAYPPLALLLYNISEIRFSGALRSILVSILAASLLALLFRLLYRNWHRATFAASALGILFFTYGQVYDLLVKEFENLPLDPWLWTLWCLLAVLGLLWAARKRTRFEKAAPGLNVIALGLVTMVSVQAIWFSVPDGSAEPAAEFASVQILEVPEGETPPDIYYIILDSYGRSDLLKRAFDYDNSAFIQDLEAMGFYVADCTQSNYNRTDVSLASSLNLDYLQNLSADYRPPSQDRRTLWASISNSTVRLMLEKAGYTSIAFASGFAWSEVDESDVYLAPNSFGMSMTSFEVLLLRTSPARYLEESGLINLTELDGRHFRERTQFILDEMDDLARMPGPKFAFIHILPPHPPFVYAPDGSFTDPAPFLNEDQRYTYESYTRGYRNQVEYITGQIETAVRTLLEKSSTPPIIILQGDHAPWLQTGNGKFLILNAYYLPGHTDLLYPTISPVNTFRLIFDTYFGTDYGLLPDTSYYSPVPNIYEFEEYPNPCMNQ